MIKNYKRGLDIELEKGTVLYSNVDGIVEFSGDSKQSNHHDSYGNIIVIKDLEGSKHLYAHLDEVSVETGKRVVKGDKLGKIGDTGRTDISRLHYEVSNDGVLLDAQNYPFE